VGNNQTPIRLNESTKSKTERFVSKSKTNVIKNSPNPNFVPPPAKKIKNKNNER